MTRQAPALITLPVLAAALVLSCASNPMTARSGPEDQLGLNMDREVRQLMGVYENPSLQQYVDGVGQRLAKTAPHADHPWHFAVLDVPAVNAFSLPGGYVYLTRGLLPFLDNEAQLAGVLGHEVALVPTARSIGQPARPARATGPLTPFEVFVPTTRPFGRMGEATARLLFATHSRDEEIRAGELAAQYVAKAGWDPHGLAQALTTLGRLELEPEHNGIPNWPSTHARPEDVLPAVNASVQSLGTGRRPSVASDRTTYLQHIEGLVWGDDPGQGLVRGHEFLLPDQRVEITLPEGWPIQKSATQVVAKAPNAEWYVLVQLVLDPLGRTATDIAASDMSRAGFTLLSGSATSIDGMSAYVGTYEGTLQDLGKLKARAAHVLDAGHVYLIVGLAPPDEYDRIAAQFDSSVTSFRRLSAERAAGIQPARVEVITVGAGDTWDSLARRSAGAIEAAMLAVMNDRDPGKPPVTGDRVKIVVSGESAGTEPGE